MKTSIIIYLILTTTILVLVAVFSVLNFPFPLIFYLVLLGKILLLITVYKVLREDYKPSSTFEEFYENVTGESKE
ncbi:hypothetical protein BC962_1922 [Gillisia mitskevichiae]|uniref:Uncharacterized protein n=1 Tax=Gillisia mitskevichiae TaxID=270921 RepID=A0A495PVZ9_9FLAO|nr:hypothetical protein [Gillisia mitskevichiae]RKS53668.1 hypothetical protein BC962_1922 [Gillisia mitskevichiae]